MEVWARAIFCFLKTLNLPCAQLPASQRPSGTDTGQWEGWGCVERWPGQPGTRELLSNRGQGAHPTLLEPSPSFPLESADSQDALAASLLRVPLLHLPSSQFLAQSLTNLGVCLSEGLLQLSDFGTKNRRERGGEN